MFELDCMQYDLNPILYTTCTRISALNLHCMYTFIKNVSIHFFNFYEILHLKRCTNNLPCGSHNILVACKCCIYCRPINYICKYKTGQ